MIDGRTMAGRPSRLKSWIQSDHSPAAVDVGTRSNFRSVRARPGMRFCGWQEAVLAMPREIWERSGTRPPGRGNYVRRLPRAATPSSARNRTPIWDRRLAVPMDIAKGILFLASDDAGYMNGAGLIVDGGLRATWRTRGSA